MMTIIYTLLMTHITMVCVTLYLHRGQAHRGIEFHPALSHFMRFWLWLTTGMITKQWVAIHRKHHRFSDVEGDPHSPVVYGIKNIFFRGVYYYYKEAKNANTALAYGKGTPNDWIERKLYTRKYYVGVFIMLGINLLLFGWIGLLVWLVQILWIPFWAAGFINGVGHWFGYRNTATRDNSRNIMLIGIICAGEEMHNNHHSNPGAVKLSQRWFEFDLGWMWLKIFMWLRLAKLRSHI